MFWEQDLLQPPEGSSSAPHHGEGAASDQGVDVTLAEPEVAADMFGSTASEWLTWNQLVPEEDVVASCWTQLIDVEQDDGRVSQLLVSHMRLCLLFHIVCQTKT